MSTTALYKALTEAGASEASAERAVEGLIPTGEVATKADVAEIRTEMANLEARLTRWIFAASALVIAAVGLIVKI